MSKVICDLCGTSFPDTATQCPICGTARPASAPANDDSHRDGKSGYTHVKGGRFSKANVRKRNKGKQVVSVNMVSDSDDNGNKSNKWIVIIAIVLLLAILAVAAYIVLHYFNSGSDQQETTQQTETSEVTEITVPCVELSVEFGSILFEEVDGSQLLDVHVMPDDTTDMITFESEDTNIAVVSADGVVTAVAPGETNIIIRCGNQSCNVLVECKFELPEQDTTDATTDATEESTEATELPDEELKLNRMDITFNRKDEQWMLYDGSLPVGSIKWSSGNEAVAVIENGRVRAVGSGTTTVYAEYKDQKVSCIIRCNFIENSGVSGSGGNITEDG